MYLKNSIRYYLGHLAQALGLTETLRKIYIANANHYLSGFPQGTVVNAWLRRSSCNADFVPFWSDIDMTLVIRDEDFFSLQFPFNFLRIDLQIIPESFLDEWRETGGIRNRQMEGWRQLKGSYSTGTLTNKKSIIAFELGYELYLLYHQLEEKLHATADPLVKTGRTKISQEIVRMMTFWKTGNQRDLLKSRHDFLADEDITSFMTTLNSFCIELLQNLDAPLNSFNTHALLTEQFPTSYAVDMEMVGKPVMIVPRPDDFTSVFGQFPEHFVALESFINLVKGVGVHEHTFLNRLTANKQGHYFKFNKQRLASDLLSALLFGKKNQKDLYFCLRNLHDFVNYNDPTRLPDWNNIEYLWQTQGKIAKDHLELQSLITAYLEVLRALR